MVQIGDPVYYPILRRSKNKETISYQKGTVVDVIRKRIVIIHGPTPHEMYNRSIEEVREVMA